ncbi:SH3 domain-containing protein [Escovopsis weberi]|uniref:SH3 domain-containing protein n=1 Tax=Escovopsis weberi TaxID=150374 RepID=A0A0M9VSC5_ESCWE|nr:SH3 domain-containing protein [Escovopsis weberi]
MADSTEETYYTSRYETYTTSRNATYEVPIGSSSSNLRDYNTFITPRASSYAFPGDPSYSASRNPTFSLPRDESSFSIPRDPALSLPRDGPTLTTPTPRSSSYTTSRDATYTFRNGVYTRDETEEFYDPLPSYDDAAAGGSRPPAKGSSKRWVNAQSKLGWPVNKAANLLGAEGFWPSHMEKECNKAARILHSFTGLGLPYPPSKNAPMHPLGLSKKSMILIPTAVLSNCAGLAIFNVVRAGAIHGSLAGGSGVVVARRPDGTWSPPSSFLVSTIGGGFMIGLDIYDCICVLNTVDQLRAFTNPRFSLGGEASVALGPLGTGASLDAAVSRTARPMWTYMKSRGIWAGIQIDGTIIITRPDCNAVFYNEKGISAKKILRGHMAWPEGGRALYDVLKCIDDPHAYNRLVWEEEEPDDALPGPPLDRQLQSPGSLAGAITSRDHKGDVKDTTEVVDEEFFADDPFADDPFGDQNAITPPAAESSSRNMTLLDGF